MIANPQTLSRVEIKAVLKRHHGAKVQIARELDINPSNITDWLRNRGNSKRVDAAIRQRAAELINAERTRTSGESAGAHK